MKNLVSWLHRWSPLRLLRNLSVWLAGGPSLAAPHPADRAEIPSRLCPTVALERVPVRPEYRRPRAR